MKQLKKNVMVTFASAVRGRPPVRCAGNDLQPFSNCVFATDGRKKNHRRITIVFAFRPERIVERNGSLLGVVQQNYANDAAGAGESPLYVNKVEPDN